MEKKPRLCALIKENLERTGFAAQGTVYCMSAAKSLSILDGEYGILLMDPPYNDPSVAAMAERVASSHLTGKDSTLVIEHSRRIQLEEHYGDFRRIKDLHHGDSFVSVYQHTEGTS